MRDSDHNSSTEIPKDPWPPLAPGNSKPVLQRGAADPFVLAHEDGWWLYASHGAEDGGYISIYHSTDLRNWTFVRGAVQPGSHPTSWNRRNFWAPEVARIGDLFHLYYTAMPDGTPKNEGNRVGLAVAPHPAGPFEDRGVVIPHGSIDGSPYQHTDGSWWLYFTAEHGNSLGLRAGTIAVHRLLEPDRVDERPKLLVDRHKWQEGACILPARDQLIMLFSTGAWTNDTYAVTWATATNPDGPFHESEKILIKTTGSLYGPGHCNWFAGPGGKPWLVFHAWDANQNARYPHVLPLRMTADGPSLQRGNPD